MELRPYQQAALDQIRDKFKIYAPKGHGRQVESKACRPRADHKEFCSTVAPFGFVYTGFDSPHYCFQTGNYRIGFKEIKALDEDLTRDNLALMARLGVTRV